MHNHPIKRALRILAGLCALAIAAPALPAGAQDPGAVTAAKPHKPRPAMRTRTAAKPVKAEARYFVEFRGRHALSYGHAYIAFGRLNGKGEIVESEVAGLHPATESSIPWTIGHLIPVPSEVGASDGDLEDEYISARYRVELSAAEYARVVAHIRHLQATSPLWWAPVYNCVSFLKDVAQYMGLKTPAVTWLYPAVFVNAMREMNKGPQHAAATPQQAAR